MSISKQRQAYGDCREIYDKSLENERGIRILMPNFDAANHLRMRMHMARVIDRSDNKISYNVNHPMYNASEYDTRKVVIRHEGDAVYLYVEPVGLDVETLEIEPLGKEVSTPQVPAPEPMKLLQSPDLPAEPVIRRRV